MHGKKYNASATYSRGENEWRNAVVALELHSERERERVPKGN